MQFSNRMLLTINNLPEIMSDYTPHIEEIYEIQSISSNRHEYLNEMIRSLIIQHEAYFSGYGSFKKCPECGRILYPLRKYKISRCSSSCRGKNRIKTFGISRTQCRERQIRWFSNNLNRSIQLSLGKCKECNEFDSFDMSIGGYCKELQKKYKIRRELTEKELLKAVEEFKIKLLKSESEKADQKLIDTKNIEEKCENHHWYSPQ